MLYEHHIVRNMSLPPLDHHLRVNVFLYSIFINRVHYIHYKGYGIYNIPETLHEHIEFMSLTVRLPLNKHTKPYFDFSDKWQTSSFILYKPWKKKDMTTMETQRPALCPIFPLRLHELYGMNEAAPHLGSYQIIPFCNNFPLK